MRSVACIGLVLLLTVSASAEGLRPGRPAGVHNARLGTTPLYLGLLAVGVLGAILVVAETGKDTVATTATSG